MNEVKSDAHGLVTFLDCIGERKIAYTMGEILFVETKERTIQVNVSDIEQMYTEFTNLLLKTN